MGTDATVCNACELWAEPRRGKADLGPGRCGDHGRVGLLKLAFVPGQSILDSQMSQGPSSAAQPVQLSALSVSTTSIPLKSVLERSC